MPDTTTILSLPFILPSQAQKHVTHNEALQRLDKIVQLVVINRSLTAPPAVATLGDRYIIAPGPTGAWALQGRRVAYYNGSAWEFVIAAYGWTAFIQAENAIAFFDGTDWKTPDQRPAEFTQVGVSATPDATNRLTVKAPATLLDNVGAGHMLKINKNAIGNTASVMFQTGYQGRAEIGTTGNDDFTIKVSPDGTTFRTGIVIDRDNGRVTAQAGVVLAPAAGDLAGPVDGAIWYNSTTGKFRGRQSGATVDLVSAGGGVVSVFSDAAFALQDNVDVTKQAAFQLSGLTTGVTRTYNLPDVSTELVGLAGSQTITGDKTFVGNTVAVDSTFFLRDNLDATKLAAFQLSGLTTGVTRTYNLPDVSTELVGLAGSQTITGDKTFAGNTVFSGGTVAVDSTFSLRDDLDATKLATFQLSSISTGTTRNYTLPNGNGTIGLLPQSAQVWSGDNTFSNAVGTFGSSTATATYGLGSGATLSASTKAVNIGTAGVAGSITNLSLGSAVAGALGTTTINSPTVTFGTTVTAIGAASANIAALYAGLGGATADATNRLAVNAPGVLFNHAGTSIEATLNKAATGDNANLAFKTGFSTRAQLGLIGTNSFTLKVSPNGSTFTDALVADATSGAVTLPMPLSLTGQASDPASPTDGQLWYNSSTGQMKARTGGVTRLIDAQQDVGWLTPVASDYVLTTAGPGGSATTTLAGVANRVEIFPFNARADIVANQLAVNVVTLLAAALGKVVIYSSDSNGRPANLILETADLDFSTAGTKTAAISYTFRQGLTYWLGMRHNSTATLSVWALTATPDINGGNAITTLARKVLRRTLTYATAAPASWGYLSSETSNTNGTAIWLRV